MTVAFGMGNAR